MSEPSIVLENVSKSFDGRIVIDSISSIFTKNEVHVILGKSGTGKSVLLKMLIGLIEPDSGTIMVNGEIVLQDKLSFLDRLVNKFFPKK